MCSNARCISQPLSNLLPTHGIQTLVFILLQLLGGIHVSSPIPLCCAPERVGGCELRPRSIWLCVDTGAGSCHGFSSWTCRSKLPSPKISAASYSRSRFLPRAWLFVRCRHIHVSSAHSCPVQHMSATLPSRRKFLRRRQFSIVV